MKIRKIEAIKAVHKKIRVCAYARVSTDSDAQAESFENQVSTYERMIMANPEYEFVAVYADQGITGRSENRPEFQHMIADCKAGKIDLIITKSISRFARNTTTVLKVTRELKELGVGVLFEENNISTMTSEGELMLTVLASFAQEESRSMSENNKWTLKKKFARGEGMVCTSRFLGYDTDETGDLVINREEAKTVRRIFDLYCSGMGSHRIAKLLNEEGVPTVTGVPWGNTSIRTIIQNEKYKGDFHIQKYYTPEGKHRTVLNTGEIQSYYVTEDHPAIVSAEQWQQAQEIMIKNRKKRNIEKGGEKYQNRYPMSGMLVCPHCGKSLRRRYVYNKKVEWFCSTYIERGKEACKGIRIRDTELTGLSFSEPMVVEEVMKDGKKYYGYTSKREYDQGARAADRIEEESSSVLPRVNRSGRTVIKL